MYYIMIPFPRSYIREKGRVNREKEDREEEDRENPGLITLKSGQEISFLCMLLRTDGGDGL